MLVARYSRMYTFCTEILYLVPIVVVCYLCLHSRDGWLDVTRPLDLLRRLPYRIGFLDQAKIPSLLYVCALFAIVVETDAMLDPSNISTSTRLIASYRDRAHHVPHSAPHSLGMHASTPGTISRMRKFVPDVVPNCGHSQHPFSDISQILKPCRMRNQTDKYPAQEIQRAKQHGRSIALFGSKPPSTIAVRQSRAAGQQAT